MGLAVAVDLAGSLATSPDGTAWTQRTSSFGTTAIFDVAYGGGQWVAVGDGGLLATSPNGVTWTQRTSSFGTTAIRGVAYGGGQWVAVGDSHSLATSPDGTAWTQRTNPFGSVNIWSVAYGNGLWVAVGGSGVVVTSPDGINWTQRTSIGTVLQSVAFASLWVGAGDSGKIATSPDAAGAWNARTSTFGTSRIYRVAYGNGLWVAVGESGKLATSPDGITWTARTSSFDTATILGAVYNDGLWVAVGGSGKIATSPDGVTWTQRTSSFSAVANIRAVAVNPNAAPNAPILADIGGIDRSIVNRFPWTFSDPDVGDSQSKFDLRYRLIGAPTWTDITGTTPNQWWDAPAGTFTAGAYEWQARTYDSSGVVGPYAASSFFTAGDAPENPTITDPINGATIGAATYTAVISAPDVDASQWRTVADNAGSPDTGTVYSDSGVLEGPVRSYTFAFPVNNRTEHLQSRIRVGGLWSQWADSRNPISYTPPPAPSATWTAVPADAAIDLAITNPAPGAGEPTVAYNDIYFAEPGEPEERKATLVPPNSTWRHWLPDSDAVYTYRIVAVASNGTTSEATIV